MHVAALEVVELGTFSNGDPKYSGDAEWLRNLVVGALDVVALAVRLRVLLFVHLPTAIKNRARSETSHNLDRVNSNPAPLHHNHY